MTVVVPVKLDEAAGKRAAAGLPEVAAAADGSRDEYVSAAGNDESLQALLIGPVMVNWPLVLVKLCGLFNSVAMAQVLLPLLVMPASRPSELPLTLKPPSWNVTRPTWTSAVSLMLVLFIAPAAKVMP